MPQHTIAWLDIVVLVIYFGGITAAGAYFAMRSKTTEEYFLGNRNFPSWAIGISMVGTSISSISFLALPADAFKTNWLRFLINVPLILAIVIAAIWILPFFRRGKITSAFEYLEGRFGPGTRMYGAIAFIISQLTRISTILFLVSLLLQEFTGWDLWLCIVVSGIFVSFYTVAGGIEAVVWTDVVQTFVLLFGGAICLYIIVRDVPGGLGHIIGAASDAGKFQFAEYVKETNSFEPASWDFTFFRRTALMMLFIGTVNFLYEYSCNQNVIQRYCASRSTRDARKAMLLCGLTSIPIWAFFMLLGSCLWVYYQEFPTPESIDMLSGKLEADKILPYFIMTKLPAGLSGLVVAGVLAAAMSSLDSSLNAITTVGIVDIYKRHIAKDRDDIHYLRVARILAIVCACIMVLGALAIAAGDKKTIQDTTTILTALTAGGLLGLYMFGFLTTIGDGRAVAFAIVCTIIFSGYRALEGLGQLPKLPIDQYYTGLTGHVLMFVLALAGGALIGKTKRDLTNLTFWTQDGKPLD